MLSKLSRLKQLLGMLAPIADNQQKTALYAAWSGNKLIFDKLLFHINSIMLPLDVQLRECPAYTLLYQFSPKDTGQSKVK